jgi:hypothetical protein
MSSDLPPRRAQAPPLALSDDEMDRWLKKRLSDSQSWERFQAAAEKVDMGGPEEDRHIRLVMNAFIADDEPVDLEELYGRMGVN